MKLLRCPCGAEKPQESLYGTQQAQEIQMKWSMSSISSLENPSIWRCFVLAWLSSFTILILQRSSLGVSAKLILLQVASILDFKSSISKFKPASSSIFRMLFPVVLFVVLQIVLRRNLHELFSPAMIERANFRNLFKRRIFRCMH